MLYIVLSQKTNAMLTIETTFPTTTTIMGREVQRVVTKAEIREETKEVTREETKAETREEIREETKEVTREETREEKPREVTTKEVTREDPRVYPMAPPPLPLQAALELTTKAVGSAASVNKDSCNKNTAHVLTKLFRCVKSKFIVSCFIGPMYIALLTHFMKTI